MKFPSSNSINGHLLNRAVLVLNANYSPMMICTAKRAICMGYLDKIEVSQVRAFEDGLLNFARTSHADVLEWIKTDDPKIKGEAQDRIKAALDEFAADFA